VTRAEPASATRGTSSVLRTSLATSVVLLALACVVSSPGAATTAAAQSGSRIQFWSGRNGRPAVWQMHVDGSDKRLLTRFPENAKRGVLSPDGRRLAFDGAAAGQPPMSNFDLQVMNLDGAARLRLTSSPEKEIDAQWSPDGKLLSYTRQADDSGARPRSGRCDPTELTTLASSPGSWHAGLRTAGASSSAAGSTITRACSSSICPVTGSNA
jgi:dipeptidyl aminopeptidase/acylaminoacyl peptidase